MGESNLAQIVVRFQVVGWHCWPDAPDHRAYLRNEHRHQFHVEIRVDVAHDDREVEFHDLLEWGRRQFPLGMERGDNSTLSCEMMCRHYIDAMARRYEGGWLQIDAFTRRHGQVSVFEDGEVGAIVAF